MANESSEIIRLQEYP